MRQADIYFKGSLAGRLRREGDGSFSFQYADTFLSGDAPPITVNLPKRAEAYHSPHLFPVFFNMLSEGANRKLQERILKIDERDHFGLLLATARHDTIGAITVHEIIDHGDPQ